MVDILNINSSISIFNSKIDAFELEIKIENYNIYDIISILINNRKIISTISEKISRLRFNIYMIWTSFLIKWQNFTENSLFRSVSLGVNYPYELNDIILNFWL